MRERIWPVGGEIWRFDFVSIFISFGYFKILVGDASNGTVGTSVSR